MVESVVSMKCYLCGSSTGVSELVVMASVPGRFGDPGEVKGRFPKLCSSHWRSKESREGLRRRLQVELLAAHARGEW